MRLRAHSPEGPRLQKASEPDLAFVAFLGRLASYFPELKGCLPQATPHL